MLFFACVAGEKEEN